MERRKMTELMRSKAIKVIENNLAYLDEVVEAAIVNLLEDEGIVEGDNELVSELQRIYDTYIGEEKYGRRII